MHIWEIAGGQQLVEKVVESERLFLPLAHVASAVFTIAVDLSKVYHRLQLESTIENKRALSSTCYCVCPDNDVQPREAIRELLWWLKAITRSEARRCDALVHQGSQLPAQLLTRARARFGKDHEVESASIFIPSVLFFSNMYIYIEREREGKKKKAPTKRITAHFCAHYRI